MQTCRKQSKATSDKVLRDSVNTYDLLNYLLTDTVEIGSVMDGYKIISDIDRLPPPVFYGKFIDHVSEVLSEKDTTYIRSQLRKRKYFNTNGLAKYGFTVVKVSELYKAKVSGEKFWDIIHNKYGPGLLTVSMPIFNRDFTRAYIRFGYSCGELCGGGDGPWLSTLGDGRVDATTFRYSLHAVSFCNLVSPLLY